jgi:nicotinamidase-related amidase
MRHPNLLAKENSFLLIIDVQEKFREHICDFSSVIKTITKLIEASKILGIPVVVTEQYPQGLGPTVAEISSCLANGVSFSKRAFSCCQDGSFVDFLKQMKRNQVIVSGIESHVCVNQSVHDLIAIGYSPHLIVEAIGSRTLENKEIGLKKMIASGAILSSLETALFELLKDSASDTFRSVQQLVK